MPDTPKDNKPQDTNTKRVNTLQDRERNAEKSAEKSAEKLRSGRNDSNDRAYDLVVFGASGFTGKLTALYIANTQKQHGTPIRWAIAGRNQAKLVHVKQSLVKCNPQCEAVGVIQADVGRQQSLSEMTKMAKVVITTVGPYIQYGEPLVKACVENGTNYVDLTGEPEFVDTVRHHYHLKAQEKRIKIVNCCGFDSIPYDLGALFTVTHLKSLFSEIDRPELDIQLEGLFRSSGRFSGGTWHSAVTAMSRVRSYNKKRKQWKQVEQPLDRMKINEQSEVGRTQVGGMPYRVSYRKDLATWACPFPTIDPSVVKRSAAIRGDYGRSFKYGHFIQIKRLPNLVVGAAAVAGVFGLAQMKPTRDLLLKIKEPGDGPSETEREKAWFKVVMQATAKGETVHAHVSGGDPGYGETSKMLAESALCLAFDGSLPSHYGVVTPSAAMGEALIKRLQSAGMEFVVDYRSRLPSSTVGPESHKVA